jgi:two-component system NtrC family response regulator
VIRAELPRKGHQVTVCADGIQAVAALEKESYDCLIVDLKMPGLNGIGVLARAKEISPDIEGIVLTGQQSMETAIEALRLNAFDYLTKPYRISTLEPVLQRVAEKLQLKQELRAARHQLSRWEGPSELIGDSPAVQNVKRLLARVAPTNSTVLIRGETGTGKELAARAVHNQSPRRDGPFVTVNCGALPENLIESELFGHGKGAFTGAAQKRAGLFEVAHGGTIFLDEIGELPRPLQAKLLRVLESNEVRRVGENEAFPVDIRVVCATHRDLDEMVEQETFREDLLFRINTFQVVMPSLRDRVQDIPVLAVHLLNRSHRVSSVKEAFTSDALQLLLQHSWPGNVRELANVVEHATIICERLPITAADLPQLAASSKRVKMEEPISLRELEMQAIESALQRHHGNKPKAAEELGISLKTLYNKLNHVADLDKSA